MRKNSTLSPLSLSLSLESNLVLIVKLGLFLSSMAGDSLFTSLFGKNVVTCYGLMEMTFTLKYILPLK